MKLGKLRSFIDAVDSRKFLSEIILVVTYNSKKTIKTC